MGQVARWVDSLSDAQRDAIIQHPDPTYDGGDWWNTVLDCGCLVGCVIGSSIHGKMLHMVLVGGTHDPLYDTWCRVGLQFPVMTERFGAPRIWRIVKARAAKANRVPVPERETVAAGTV